MPHSLTESTALLVTSGTAMVGCCHRHVSYTPADMAPCPSHVQSSVGESVFMESGLIAAVWQCRLMSRRSFPDVSPGWLKQTDAQNHGAWNCRTWKCRTCDNWHCDRRH